MNPMLISTGNLKKDALSGKTVLLTGAGGGIGFETARALLWLGAKVIVAEIDRNRIKAAKETLRGDPGEENVFFERVDIGSKFAVKRLVKKVNKKYGYPDVIFNNATVVSIGAVQSVGVSAWEKSFRVNLRGPVLLITGFLPAMLKRKSGVIVFVPSSGAAPYMGAYEVFKTSQVELSNTLVGELEGTGVITYSIGPGIVKTDTSSKAIEIIAPLYGKSVEEFFEMNKAARVTPEEAGAGFAASVAMAERYNGVETSSVQALSDAGIAFDTGAQADVAAVSPEIRERLHPLIGNVIKTFSEQADGWQKRVVFERQWVIRDFKKYTGAAPEAFIDGLKTLQKEVAEGRLSSSYVEPLNRLDGYYRHQIDLLKGFEKNPQRLAENLGIMQGWLDDLDKVRRAAETVRK